MYSDNYSLRTGNVTDETNNQVINSKCLGNSAAINPALATGYKSSSNKGTGINSDLVSDNQQFAKELRKSDNKKFKKLKVHSFFKDNMQGADLADM